MSVLLLCVYLALLGGFAVLALAVGVAELYVFSRRRPRREISSRAAYRLSGHYRTVLRRRES